MDIRLQNQHILKAELRLRPRIHMRAAGMKFQISAGFLAVAECAVIIAGKFQRDLCGRLSAGEIDLL